MNFRRFSGLVAMGVAALAMMAATASASTITSPAGTHYTSLVRADSEGEHVRIHRFPFSVVTCEFSRIEWQVEKGIGIFTTARGPVTHFSLGFCSQSVTILKKGTIEVHKGGWGSGEYDLITWTGAELTIGGCTYRFGVKPGETVAMGALTNSSSTGATATIDMASNTIPTVTYPGCGIGMEMTGIYEISTPDYLDVD